MRYNGTNMDAVLEDHAKYLKLIHDLKLTSDDEKLKADFSNCDLKGHVFQKLDLSFANFSRANLANAMFLNVVMNETIFGKSQCTGASFISCKGYRTVFNGTDMHVSRIAWCSFGRSLFKETFAQCMSLHGTNIINGTFNQIDFSDSIITNCSFYESSFNNVNMFNVHMTDCNMQGTNFSPEFVGTNGLKINKICPSDGSFIGWKTCELARNSSTFRLQEKCIVKLRIPEDALRSNAFGRKCRCNKVEVLSIETLDGQVLGPEFYGISFFDRRTTYKVGTEIYIHNFDENPYKECSTGIHFFITKEEALAYMS